MKTFEETWTKCSDKLPESGQHVWIIYPSGYEYPAQFQIWADGSHSFVSASRGEVMFCQQPDFWRPRN